MKQVTCLFLSLSLSFTRKRKPRKNALKNHSTIVSVYRKLARQLHESFFGVYKHKHCGEGRAPRSRFHFIIIFSFSLSLCFPTFLGPCFLVISICFASPPPLDLHSSTMADTLPHFSSQWGGHVSHYAAPLQGRAGQRRLPLLLITALVLFLCSPLISPVTAMKTRLFSSEFHFSSGVPMADNLAANGGPSHCVIVDLDPRVNAISGKVRYAYESNVTTVRLRLPLVISVHRPEPTVDSQTPLMTDPKAITATYIVAPEEFDVLREAVDAQGNQLSPGAALFARSRSVDVYLSNYQEGYGSRTVEGPYAVCFSLDTTRQGKASGKHTQLIEMVEIEILEVTAGRGKGHKEKHPVKHVGDGGLVAELHDDMERNILRMVGGNIDDEVQELIRVPKYVSWTDLKETLKELRRMHSVLLSIVDGTANLRERNVRMQMTVDSTYRRIAICTVCVIVVLGAYIGLTFYYLRYTIVKKKLI